MGDTLPILTGTLLNPDLTAVDLTDAALMLRLFQMATSTVIELTATLSGTDATKGLVEHLWVTGETDEPGAYFYQWIALWPDHQESFPNDSRGLVLSIES